jgi:hypothetical protein
MSQYAAGGLPSSQQAAYGAGYAAAGAGAGAALGAGLASSRTDLSSDGGDGAGVHRGPSTGSTLTSAGFAGRGTGNAYYGQGGDTQMPTPVPTGTSSSTHDNNPYGAAATPSTAASRKMREAQQERLRNMYAQNDHANEEGSPTTAPTSPSGETSSSMPRVHEDGGRYVPEGGEELPPQSVCMRILDELSPMLIFVRFLLSAGTTRSRPIVVDPAVASLRTEYDTDILFLLLAATYICISQATIVVNPSRSLTFLIIRVSEVLHLEL